MSLRPIYYDTETTGVKSETDRIIELAAYDPVMGETFETLINPGMPIPKESTAIHNITDEMVKDAPTFEKVAQRFIDFTKGDCILIAHNNDSFDKLFLEREFQRTGIPMPEYRFLDSLKWARKYRYDLPRHSLQYLREVYDIPANTAHRALDDVIVLYKVFSNMIGDLDLLQAWELINQTTMISHMPFGKHQGKILSKVPKDYVNWLKNNGAFDKKDNKALRESFEQIGML